MSRALGCWMICIPILGLGGGVAQNVPRTGTSAPSKPDQDEKEARGSAPTVIGLKAEDARALRELVQKFTKAYNAGDSASLGALFTEDGEVIGDGGETVTGREEIVARYASTFQDEPGAILEIQPSSIRAIGVDTAIERGEATLARSDSQAAEPTPYSVVYVKQGGQWLQAILRDELDSRPRHHERLRQLEWMVGEWVNESDEAVVATNCHWSEDGNYLVRDFDVKIEGRVALRGTQRIGWDPHLEQFRSWVFDNEGGFAEGVLAREGAAWLIKASGVSSDGQVASSTSVLTPLGKDRVAWQVTDRTVAGEAVPDADRFILVRKPPEPGR